MYMGNNWFIVDVAVISGTKLCYYRNPMTAAYGVLNYMYEHDMNVHKVLCTDTVTRDAVVANLYKVYYQQFAIGDGTIIVDVDDNLIRIRIED